MNFQRRNVKQLLAHPPYYQKFSFTKEEYMGLLEVAEKEYARHSPGNYVLAGLGLGVLGFLVGDGFTAISGPLIALYATKTASSGWYHAINLKNLMETKMTNKDYQITKREYITKTRTGIEKDQEAVRVTKNIWDIIFWCKSAPQIKLRRNNFE